MKKIMTLKNFMFLLLVICSVSIISCKKVPERIGNTIQPESSYIRVSFTGTQDIYAETQRVDSLSTKSANYMLLGDMYDPVFGNSNLGFYTQLSLTTNGHEWGENPVADSVVLQLTYSNYYGDTTQQQIVRVYEIAEDMIDTTYYSNTILECGDEIGCHQFFPRPKTFSNFEYDTINTAVLRIPIDTMVAHHFFHDEEANFTSNTAFTDYFKGIHLKCDNTGGTGSICYFNITNSNTYMRVYYHNDSDTSFYDFDVTTSNIRYNYFEHDYEAAVSPIRFNDSTDNRYLFLQGAAGTRAFIKFPNLAQWAANLNTNVLVNEAKLIMKSAPAVIDGAINDTATFRPPTQLVVVKVNADGSYSTLPDQYVGTNYYGGTFKNGEVWFRISEYIQDLILAGPDAENYGIYLYVNAGSYNPSRWVLNGPDYADTTSMLRLDLIYSEIDD